MSSKSFDQLRFDNSYARLPEPFYSRVLPALQNSVGSAAEPYLVCFNVAAAQLLDLAAEESQRDDIAEILSGRHLLAGSEPLAAVYAGHQFGVYVSRLGDGRAILLGEVVNDQGERWDLQLKGAGPTPYSRMGDGYAVLRSTIREYLASEALHGLGIATTRALSIVGNDASVYRETVETGAILMRLAPTHVRFGTFEYFSHTRQHELLKQLTDYVIAHHYPRLCDIKEPADRYAHFFAQVVERTAHLMAHWQAVGFAHGVMNTDNMSILGLTIDYGPYGFLDQYEPGFICNDSDHQGRYAFKRQPNIALWNLACLAQALVPLIEQQTLKSILNDYAGIYNSFHLELMRAKIGLQRSQPDDAELIQDLLVLMARSKVDYTNTWRSLADFNAHDPDNTDDDSWLKRFVDQQAIRRWAQRYAQRLTAEQSDADVRRRRMNQVNPKYVLRNYLAQVAIEKAQQKDFTEIARLLEVLSKPYDEQEHYAEYAVEPPSWGRHLAVSCSS